MPLLAKMAQLRAFPLLLAPLLLAPLFLLLLRIAVALPGSFRLKNGQRRPSSRLLPAFISLPAPGRPRSKATIAKSAGSTWLLLPGPCFFHNLFSSIADNKGVI